MIVPLALPARLAPLGVSHFEFYIDLVDGRPIPLDTVLSVLRAKGLVGSAIAGTEVGISGSALIRVAADAELQHVLVATPDGALTEGPASSDLSDELRGVFGCEVYESWGSFYWDYEGPEDGPFAIQSISVIEANTPASPLSILLNSSGGYYSVSDGHALIVPPLTEKLDSYLTLETVEGPMITCVRAGNRRSLYLSDSEDIEFSLAAHKMPEGTSLGEFPAGSLAHRVSSILALESGMDVSEESPWWQDSPEDAQDVQSHLDDEKRPLEILLMQSFDELLAAPEHEFFSSFASRAQLPQSVIKALADFEHNGVPGLPVDVDDSAVRPLVLDGIRLTPITQSDVAHGTRTSTAIDLMFPKDVDGKVPLKERIQLSVPWRVLAIAFYLAAGTVGILTGFNVGPLAADDSSSWDQGMGLIVGAALLLAAYSGVKGLKAPERARALIDRAVRDGAYTPQRDTLDSLSIQHSSTPRPPSTRKRGSNKNDPPPGMIKL